MTTLQSLQKAHGDWIPAHAAHLLSKGWNWLALAQKAQAAGWSTLRLPDRKMESWRYSDLAALRNCEFSVTSAASAANVAAQTAPPELALSESAFEVVFVDGVFKPEWSRLPSDGSISLLSQAIDGQKTRDKVLRLFQTELETPVVGHGREQVFRSVNSSFVRDAVLVQVNRGAALGKPLRISHWAGGSTAAGSQAIFAPRVQVVLEENAQAVICERFFSSPQGSHFTNALSHYTLESGARLELLHLQSQSDLAVHLAATTITQARDSESKVTSLSLGARFARHEVEVKLGGEGASCALAGLTLLNGTRHGDHLTSVHHLLPRTQSEQLFKGIAAGESRSVFNGAVHMHRGAVQSTAAQLNKSLLLSAKAEADSKPELVIEVDDVKATHGATVGQLDPEHLFYMEARGIERSEAERLLARGFAAEVVFAHLRNELLCQDAMRVLGEHLDQFGFGGLGD